jgi:hypothetical protein
MAEAIKKTVYPSLNHLAGQPFGLLTVAGYGGRNEMRAGIGERAQA